MKRRDPLSHWRHTRSLTLRMLLLWCLLTFGGIWFAPDLNQITFMGFPFGFYLSAQGALIFYIGLVWYYNRKMRQLDEEYGIDE